MKIDTCTAIVTGGASGLGLATAHYLKKRGAAVCLFDKTIPTDLTSLFATYACDVTQEADVLAALDKVESEHGIPQILINCAGIVRAKRVLGKNKILSLDEFKEVIEVNLMGTMNTIRLIAARMATLTPNNPDDERGVIINTASIAATEGQIGQAAYAASKAGIQGLTLPLAREFAQFGIRVITISPGVFETPMIHGMAAEIQKSLRESSVFPKRLGRPEEFGALVAHIIENTMLNGEIIRLDGALRL